MDLESTLRLAIPVLSGLLTLALGIAVYMIRSELRNHVSDAVLPITARIAVLETAHAVMAQQLEDLPRQSDLHRLEVLLTQAAGDLSAVKGDTGRVEQEVRHITRWMTDHGGKS